MTITLTEGFDWLASGDLPTGYGSFTEHDPNAAGPTHAIGTGRNGDGSYKLTCANDAGAELQDLQGIVLGTGGITSGTIIVGFAVKFSTITDSGIDMPFFMITNPTGTERAVSSCILARTTSGTLAAGSSNQAAATLDTYAGATGSKILSVGIWYYIEIKFVGHASTGSVTVRVNGVQDFTTGSINTSPKVDDDFAGLVFGTNEQGSNLPITEYDDVYVEDTSFLGDMQVQTLSPNGNGTTSDLTGSDADSTDNYLHVDEATPDDDTSYVEDNTATNKDTYAYAATSNVGTVKCVTVKTVAKKVDGGAANIKAVARSNGTETDSSELGLSTSYTAVQAIYETDPDTAAAWLAAAIDAAEFGIKIA